MPNYQVHEAARDDKPLTVQNLLAEDPALALVKDEDQRIPLHWACTMNHEHIVDLILPHLKGKSLDDMVDEGGWTPVHIAAATGNENILKKLLEFDPDFNVDQTTATGSTALQLAVSKNYYDIVSLLLEKHKASARLKDKKGSTAMHRAAAIGSQPIIKLLAAAKTNLNAKDSYGWTPLHHALAEGHGDVGVLLVSLGADPDVEGGDGEKPVDVANNEGVKKFFQAGI